MVEIQIHNSHVPEEPHERFLDGWVICKTCCRFVANLQTGPTQTGTSSCRGNEHTSLLAESFE